MSNIINIIAEKETNERSAIPRLGSLPSLTTVPVDSSVLASNFTSTLETLQEVMAKQPTTAADFELDEVEFSLALNASGGFELIGKATVGIQAGVKVKLKRRK